MGIYLNPGNKGFQEVLRSGYIDKTGMISLVNQTIWTIRKLNCVSRPRRFGKSFAAKMLCAYYDCSCDSSSLFDDKEIAETEGYLEHLNKYNVVSLDITGFISNAKIHHRPLAEVPGNIENAVHRELQGLYPNLTEGRSLLEDMIRCAEGTGRGFVFIIDEWDALIREARGNPEIHSAYLNLLRSWFKNSDFTPKAVAAAYMTGILPIKKDGSQSAISDFSEYTILNPGRFVKYTGFAEDEVRTLCAQHGMEFDEVRQWYDGYDFAGYGSIYNPYSVMCAMHEGECRSYWRRTSATESLLTYINMDFDGMQEAVSRLISGEGIAVYPDEFENDLETFRSRDDVLTLLIHLGYLTWNKEDGTAHIPNEEVRGEFRQILRGTGVNHKWIELLSRSQKLLEDTLAGNGDAVAEAIDRIRQTQYAPTYYNNEQALRYVIKFAYIAALDQYLKVEELPSGRGIADVVYLPKRLSNLPALVIELKWNRSSDGAIGQIRDRKYPAILSEYGGETLLVGINYDETKKTHSCTIERA